MVDTFLFGSTIVVICLIITVGIFTRKDEDD